MKIPVKNSNKLSLRFVRIRPSRLLLLAVLAMHVCSLLAVFTTALSFMWQCLLAVLLFASAGYCCHQWRRCPSHRLQKQGQQWMLIDESVTENSVSIIKCYYWSRWVVVFYVVSARQHYSYFAVPWDRCSKDDFHLLRLISRFELETKVTERKGVFR